MPLKISRQPFSRSRRGRRRQASMKIRFHPARKLSEADSYIEQRNMPSASTDAPTRRPVSQSARERDVFEQIVLHCCVTADSVVPLARSKSMKLAIGERPDRLASDPAASGYMRISDIVATG
jgi:hypothetical protein